MLPDGLAVVAVVLRAAIGQDGGGNELHALAVCLACKAGVGVDQLLLGDGVGGGTVHVADVINALEH